ncbi:lipase maturation factor 2 isoform X2 [Saimiri boliviensis]|uniref:lipase maturation factor 2 isoform X2 n=1 Tax=Saimiri boliviensis TaxID=27679 RepID=UPI00193CAF5E|nr:lipase maturation factor 2 isoform X3 [Saimiri boliviensis boliviensis]
MAGSRLPRQLFLQGVAAVFMFAFASLYTQIPGLYGPEGILPARRMLRPQGKGRWQQLWETPTLLWEAPRLGLDTAQGLELLSLLGALLALGALLLSPLRHPAVFLLLWAAYLSACQVGQVFLYFQWDSLLLETGFLAVLVAPLRPAFHRKQAPQRGQAGALPHEGLPFWLVRWLLFRLMFASGVVKLTSRCPAWWGLTALTYHYETQCLPTPAAWFAHHLPVWLHKLSVVATFLIEIAVPPLFFAPIRRLRLAAFYSQVLLQVLIIITGNYNFFNLMTLVLTTALLDDQHLAAEPGHSSRKKTAMSRPKALLATLSLLLELAIYGFLAYGTVHYFGLEVDWQQRTVHSRTILSVAEDTDAAHRVAGCSLPGLGAAECPLEVDPGAGLAAEAQCCSPTVPRGHCHRGLVPDQPGAVLLRGTGDPRAPLDWGPPSIWHRGAPAAGQLLRPLPPYDRAWWAARGGAGGQLRWPPLDGDRVHVQAWEPEPATPSRGAPPTSPGLANVVCSPGPAHTQPMVHKPGPAPAAGQGASDPPRPEPSGQVSLPQAATHLPPSPALQVLVLSAWGAGPVVAAPVGGGVLPTRIPGGPSAGDAAQAIWAAGQEPTPGPWRQQHPGPGPPLDTYSAVSLGGPFPALGAPHGCGGCQSCAGPASTLVSPVLPLGSSHRAEAQASPPERLWSYL